MESQNLDSIDPVSKLSIRTLLVITTIVAVYIGILAGCSNHFATRHAIFWALGCLAIGTIAVGMMVANLVRQKQSAPSAMILIAAVFFATLNIVAFITTIQIDSFAIFSMVYLGMFGEVAPALVVILTLITASFIKLGDLGIAGLAIWTGCVSLLHVWIIAQCAASI